MDPRSRAAFARVEESIRQFTSHSRESIAIVRNPFTMVADHFVVLWAKGAAVSAFVHHGGKVRGGMQESWSEESSDRQRTIDFENPLPQLGLARRELLSLFGSTVAARPLETIAAEEEPPLLLEEEDRATRAMNARIQAFEHCTRGLIVLTEPVERVRIDQLEENRELAILSLEQAVTRTIFHMPNLLRIIDFETSFFTPEEIGKVVDLLEEDAATQSSKRASYTEEKKPAARRNRTGKKSPLPKYIGVAIAIIAIGALLYSILGPSDHPPQTIGPDDTSHVVQPQQRATKSVIVLVLPEETQAFVSPNQYNTRAELLRGIGAGEGRRMLPQKEQPIELDSTTFAKGVYGYFKVEGQWRRGKLLQTLKAQDTVIIENFLPPLP